MLMPVTLVGRKIRMDIPILCDFVRLSMRNTSMDLPQEMSKSFSINWLGVNNLG